MHTTVVSDFLKKVEALADELRQSPLYQDYKASKEALEKDPALMQRVMEYKKVQTAFEYKRLQGKSVSFDAEKHVAHMSIELMLDSDISKFLACERALLELYRKSFDILCDACDMEIF